MDLQSRETLVLTHVVELEHSFMRAGYMENIKIMVVVFTQKELNTEQEREKAFTKAKKHKALKVIAGRHRGTAGVNLRGRFPMNDKFKKMPLIVFFCQRNAWTVMMLRRLGTAENIISSTHTRISLIDQLTYMRRDVMDQMSIQNDQEFDVGLLERGALAAMKRRWIRDFKMKDGPATGLSAIATKPPSVWERIAKILRGESRPPQVLSRTTNTLKASTRKNVVIPKSYSFLTGLGGMPDDMQCALLDRVLDGSLSCNNLIEACKTAKAEIKIKNHIVHLAKVQTYEEARRKMFNADNIVRGFTTTVKNMGRRDAMPQTLEEQINDDLQRFALSQQQQLEVIIATHPHQSVK